MSWQPVSWQHWHHRRHRPPWWRLATLVGWLVIAACSPTDDATLDRSPVAEPPATATSGAAWQTVVQAPLEVGIPRQATLSPGQSHQYPLTVPQGHAVLLEATQDEVDLVIEITAPDGQILHTVDRLGILATERVCFISQRAGIYRMGIRPFGASGRYQLRLLHAGPATEADRRCVLASEVFEQALAAEDAETQHAGFARAARLWTSAGEPAGATIAWRALGDALEDAGSLDQALAHFATAHAIAKDAGLVTLQVNLGNRQGRALRQADRWNRAAAVFDQALALAREAGDVRGEAAILTNRGLVDVALGDSYRAQYRYRQALDLWRELHDPIEIAQALSNLGEALGTINHHQEALDVLDEALALTREAGASQREAGVLAAIGWTHHLRGRSQEGLAPMRQALALRRKGEERWSKAGVLDRLGTLLLATGDRQGAEDAYQQALSIARSLEDGKGYAATIQTSLGCMLAETDRYQEAEALFAQALTYAQEQEQDDTRKFDRSHTDYCVARLAHYRGDLDGALRHARHALDVVEGIRERAREQGHRYQPIGLWQDYAALEVSLLLERFRDSQDVADLERAFEAADQTRARRLFELVVATRAGAETAANQERDAREIALQKELSALSDQRTEAASQAAPEARESTDLEAAIRRLQLELETLRAEARAGARGRGLLQSPKPVSVGQALALLGPQSVLLTYVLGAESSHLLALTSGDLKVFDLPSRAVLEVHAEGLYAALKNSGHEDHQWRLIADRLGPMLLPAAAIPASTKRLLIIAQGALHYVPFGVLPTPKANHQDQDAAAVATSQARLVLDDFEVVTVPSAAVLAALRTRRERRPPARKTVAVIADAVFSAQDPRFLAIDTAGAADAANSVSRGIPIDRLPDGPLPRLPATADEADAIGDLVSAGQQLQLRGWQATKEAVLNADLGAYRILHFATHAWVDERFPELSGLLLTQVDRAGHALDGGLHLHEIDSLHLASDLTVLSGCQTALGQKVRGDGLLGLTQGFFHAGSSQVLVSLWSVDDVAASLLMAELYRQMLAHGQTPASALQHAQRWLRAQDGYAAPRHWAPFVLQGDG